MGVRLIKETVTTKREVDGSILSLEEEEITWRVAIMETDYAKAEMQYKGQGLSTPPIATYYGPKADELAIDVAKHFCRNYRVERGDPLVVAVYSWTERVECKTRDDDDDEIWYRTDKPPIEDFPKRVVWSSA